MRAAVALLALLAGPAAAQPFVEIGAGAPLGGCLRYRTDFAACSPSPLGSLTVGWQFGNFSVEWEHRSSLATATDRGDEMLSLRWRFVLGQQRPSSIDFSEDRPPLHRSRPGW